MESTSQASPTQDDFISTIILDLYPYLMSTWVETSGAVFEDSSQLNAVTPDLAALHLAMRLVLWSWRFETSNTQPEVLDERFQQFQKHVVPNFPFGQNHRIANNGKLTGLLHEMNSAVAEISALYYLKSDLSGGASNSLKSTSKKVVDYLLSALNDSSTPRERLVALFPSLWWFLNGNHLDSCRQLFQALMDFTIPLLPCSAQLAALDFLHKILIVEKHPHYTGSFRLQKHPGYPTWISNLCHSLSPLDPKYEHHSVVIKVIVNILHQAIRFDPLKALNICQMQQEIALLIKGGKFSMFLEPQQFHLICGLYHAVGLAPELLEALSDFLSSPIEISFRLRERIDSLLLFAQ
ncbi:rRNA processing protein [Entomophthora muscae]|uniref:rRNA processing protein n=1 Tax=Entomophthora muscae TaxID=34485 RepID=A0ACC2T6X2_9FUNG|nr:rRNA processing protein [Entomophthora muscae]